MFLGNRFAVLPDASQDLVITDPPFGELLHYSELSDFFYVWLRLAVLKNRIQNYSRRNLVPKPWKPLRTERDNRKIQMRFINAS